MLLLFQDNNRRSKTEVNTQTHIVNYKEKIIKIQINVNFFFCWDHLSIDVRLTDWFGC